MNRVGTGGWALSTLILIAAATPARLDAQASEDPPAHAEADDTAPGSRRQRETEGTPPPRTSAWGVRWTNHPSLYIGRSTTISLKARIRADVDTSAAPTRREAGAEIGRRRIGTEGVIAGLVGFEFDYELADDEPWRDAYLEYRQFRAVRISAGLFKLPFSLDENTSAPALDFAYRTLAATQLAPGRDPGVMVSGRLLGGVLRYEAGRFAHDGRNARTGNPDRVHGGRTQAGRLSVQPFGAPAVLREVRVAVAMTGSSVPEGFQAVQGRTVLAGSFFTPDWWVQGHRRRTGLEAQWRSGPFSLTGEYIRLSTERRGMSVEDSDLPPLVGTGWYVSGTWLATGERKTGGPVRPRRPLFRGGPGAVELAVRLEGLAFDSHAAPDALPSTSPRAEKVLGNSERAATLGITWYPVRGVRIQGNVIRESIADPARGPLPAQPAFWSRILRVQLAI